MLQFWEKFLSDLDQVQFQTRMYLKNHGGGFWPKKQMFPWCWERSGTRPVYIWPKLLGQTSVNSYEEQMDNDVDLRGHLDLFRTGPELKNESTHFGCWMQRLFKVLLWVWLWSDDTSGRIPPKGFHKKRQLWCWCSHLYTTGTTELHNSWWHKVETADWHLMITESTHMWTWK